MVEIDIHDEAVVQSLRTLEANGFSLDVLLQCADEDIKDFAPSLISALQALRLKIALRRERKRIEGELNEKQAYKNFVPFLGRVNTYFQDNPSERQYGNCVLVANPGVAITALHVLQKEVDKKVEDSEGTAAEGSTSKKRRKLFKFVKVPVPILEIQVKFPNTQGGVLSYRAKIVATSCVTDDLALIRPVEEDLPFFEQFRNLPTLQRWLPYQPRVDDRVLLLSFPSCKGENWFSNSPTIKDDLPWFAKGSVSCFDAKNGHGFASYVSFEGASGALIVHLDEDGRAKPMIHLGTYHESQEIRIWNADALPLLNESLFQKGCNGYFTINTGSFLEQYFVPPPDVLSQNLHPQVARVEVKEHIEILDQISSPQVACVEGREHIEVLDDIFSPWPGLDNLEDEN